MERVGKIKSVKKMNKMLYQCKELVMGINFHEYDEHHKFLKEKIISFGIASNQFDQAWLTIKKVWASKFNERAFLATKKLGVQMN